MSCQEDHSKQVWSLNWYVSGQGIYIVSISCLPICQLEKNEMFSSMLNTSEDF